MTLPSALQQAVAWHQQGRLDDAEMLYAAVLKADPRQFDALHLLGMLKYQQGQLENAATLLRSALASKRRSPEALSNYGLILQALGRHEEAVANYDRAIALKRDHADALNNRGNALRALGRRDEALASYNRALKARPGYPEAFNNRGAILQDAGHHAEALASYEQALAVRTDYVEALYNRGNVLRALGRNDEALASYDQAIALARGHVEALSDRGGLLQTLGRHQDAIASCDLALAINPRHADALNNCGIALQELGRREDALASYDRALAVDPNHAAALGNRGFVLQQLGRHADAQSDFKRLLALKPDHAFALGGLAHSTLCICDWSNIAQLTQELDTRVAEQRAAVSPFVMLLTSGSPELQLRCAREFTVYEKLPVAPPVAPAIRQHGKIRLGYVSANYSRHPVAFLIAELIERHDRSRFDVFGIGLNRDDGSDIRARLIGSFDQFHEVRLKSDHDAAALMRELEVDIAIDLMGYTQDSRPGILAHRPAPVQINYLGYPGTMGADFIDYVIADNITVPPEHQSYFSEQVIRLPDCYQSNDRKRAISPRAWARQDAGLPEQGFVFCCFNNSFKIVPAIFDVWMRLLSAVDGSVLWLLRANEAAEDNLKREAAARGIDPARLVFADRQPNDEHLARHRLADLFLDTLPYNAHTTASDALWAGLPLLTCLGTTFAGRVGASIVLAAGLPELVTHDLTDYEAMALRLATDPELLGAFRRRLADNRLTCPLFDTDRFTRHIEAAYVEAWERWRRGDAPRGFNVDAAAI